MNVMASRITSLTIVYSTVYSGADQRKHQSPASLAFVWGIHRWPVNSPHKWPVTRKMFPFDDVIMEPSECQLVSMGKCKKAVTPLLTHWNCAFLVLTYRYWKSYLLLENNIHCLYILRYYFKPVRRQMYCEQGSNRYNSEVFYRDVTWALRCLESPNTQLLVQQYTQANKTAKPPQRAGDVESVSMSWKNDVCWVDSITPVWR